MSRKGFFSSLRLEAMRERKQTKPVRWRKTMSFPTARIIQIRHGVPFTGTIKNHSAPCNPSIYATLNRVQSDKRSVTPAHDTESPSSTANASLRPTSRSRLRVERVLIKHVPSLLIRSIMRFRVAARNDKEASCIV